MKRLLVVMLLLLAPVLASAEELKVQVKGMVCSFCAQGIKKTFSKQDAVEDIKVDLDSKIIQISFKEGKTLTDEEVKTLINDSGYDVVSIEREK